jgi:hypothetical protein
VKSQFAFADNHVGMARKDRFEISAAQRRRSARRQCADTVEKVMGLAQKQRYEIVALFGKQAPSRAGWRPSYS